MEKVSLLQTINDVVNNRTINEAGMAMIEQGTKEMRNAGLSYSGQIQIPMEYRANIQATVANAGQEAIAEDKMEILAPLYEDSVFSKAGATFMTGLVGDLSIPVYSGSNVAWKGEVATGADGAGTFSEVNLTPKRLTAVLTISKQFLNQNSESAERMLQNDLANAVRAKLESTVFGNGAGSATQPAGLFNGVNADTVAVDYKGIVSMETALDEKNIKNKVFVISPKAKAELKTTDKGTSTGNYLMNMNNEVIGYPAITSSAVDGKGVICGDFSELIVAQWGNLDIQVDPFTKAADGCIQLVVNAYFDVKPRRAEAFAKKVLKA